MDETFQEFNDYSISKTESKEYQAPVFNKETYINPPKFNCWAYPTSEWIRILLLSNIFIVLGV